MESFLANLPQYLSQASEFLSALVVFATIIAKLTPTPKDDKIVSKVSTFILKYIKFLPTIGTNPSTKKLEEQLKKK